MGSRNRNVPQKKVIQPDVVEPINQSGILEFSKKPWVIILTIAIALSGGVPGIISTIAYFDNRPEISITIGTSSYGHLQTDKGVKLSTFMFSCALYNKGNKSLIPGYFKAEVRFDGKVKELTPFKIPDSLTTHTDGSTPNVSYKNAKERDLQYLKKLAPDESFNGLLLFESSNELPEILFHAGKREYKITCVDYSGKEFSTGWINLDGNLNSKFMYSDSVDMSKEGVIISK